jgi:hypothetical protein
MNDPYRITSESESTGPRVRTTGLLRPVLWVLLIVSAMGNAISSGVGLHPAVGIAFGVLTLGFVAALVADHYRRRRQS